MFEAAHMLFMCVETPLHAGSGRQLGTIDLPIQRERTTNYPIIQASSVKGRLRAECKGANCLSDDEHLAVFGPETGNASDHAGALSVGDARILLFPVRSLSGVFAWTTSVNVLARFCRDMVGVGVKPDFELPPEPDSDRAWVGSGKLNVDDSIVLEEFSFISDVSDKVKKIGEWLASNALPISDEYAYWRTALPEKLCILHDDAFRDFVQYGTEVQTHIKLDPATKTVSRQALWIAESLPADTLLYCPLMATKSRKEGVELDWGQILERISKNLTRTRLGGDETTGQGVVAVRFFAQSGGEQK